MKTFTVCINKHNFNNLCEGKLDYILVRYNTFYCTRLLYTDKSFFKFDRIVINNSWKKKKDSQIIFEHKSTSIQEVKSRRYIRINLGIELARG